MISIKKPNIGHSIFAGINNDQGIMICGYEWGGDENEAPSQNDMRVEATFANKFRRYGEPARHWKYDNRIKKWFKMLGHEFNENDAGIFEKCIVQTNWCDTQGKNIKEGIIAKLLAADAVENFIDHIEIFRPKLIFFMGSSLIEALQNDQVLKKFEKHVGPRKTTPCFPNKPFTGRKFKIGFQSFEKCNIVSLPHPSGSRGLNDEYIKLFTDDISPLIEGVKKIKGC